jgi:hemolysin activation/secretion protein
MALFGSELPYPKNIEEAVKINAEVFGSNVRVTMKVAENPVVKSIVITGSGPLSTGVIQTVLRTRVGNVLDLRQLQRDVSAIREAYESSGFQAFLSEDLGVREGQLTIPIVVGRIGDLRVVGIKKRNREVVLKQISSKVGDYYNVRKMREALTKLYNTNWFRNVEPQFAFPVPGRVDVTFAVREKWGE